jgi:hypothetical protein
MNQGKQNLKKSDLLFFLILERHGFGENIVYAGFNT